MLFRSRTITSPNIILRRPTLDIVDYIANADYYVQLSDAEGYCYSVVEALSVGTPVIVTDFKVAREIGVKDGVNGFVLPMDMSKVPVDSIYKGVKKFKYTPLEDCWDKLLVPGKAENEDDDLKMVKVRVKRIYLDIQLNREMRFGEEFECTMRRADELEELNLVEILGE